jgi:hypothetical protein
LTLKGAGRMECWICEKRDCEHYNNEIKNKCGYFLFPYKFCRFYPTSRDEPVSNFHCSALLCKKPPIGLKPKTIHDQQRGLEILAAMTRYVEANKTIPEEWVYELDALYGVA